MDASFSYGASMITETWVIEDNGSNLRTFLTQVLGYPVASGTSIIRHGPAPNNRFPHMYASRVTSIKGYVAGGTTTQVGGVAKYALLAITIQFEAAPYVISNAAAPSSYIIPDVAPSLEFFQQNMGKYVWEASAPSGLAGQVVQGPGGVAIQVQKTRYTWTWVQVPDIGLFSGGFPGRPTKIESCLGKVNNAAWQGYPQGTLLFESWKPTPHAVPVPINLGQFERTWDVQLTFLYFEPPFAGSGTMQGHNLLPLPGTNTWYRAYVQGTSDTSGNWRYNEVDFNTIFQMN